LQGYLEKIYDDLPPAKDGGTNEIYVMRFKIDKGKKEEFLKKARKMNDRRRNLLGGGKPRRRRPVDNRQ
jgi:hypothetical protein